MLISDLPIKRVPIIECCLNDSPNRRLRDAIGSDSADHLIDMSIRVFVFRNASLVVKAPTITEPTCVSLSLGSH